MSEYVWCPGCGEICLAHKRFCDQCGTSLEGARPVTPAEKLEITKDLYDRRALCARCGLVRPTHQVKFQRNIGLIVVRHIEVIEGNLCQECIEKVFRDFQLRNLLFGWWGVISFFATWAYLFENGTQYARAMKYFRALEQGAVSQPTDSAAESGKKPIGLVGLVLLVLVGICAWGLIATIASEQVASPTSLSTYQAVPVRPTATRWNYPTATPRKYATALPTSAAVAADCLWWWNAVAYVGTQQCICGTVKRVQMGDTVSFVHFGEDKESFYAYSYAYHWKSEDIVGRCVVVCGRIEENYGRPRMRIDGPDQVFFCAR